MRRPLVALGLCILFFLNASVAGITIVCWNVVPGGANPAVVTARIKEINRVDVWGLCEAQDATWAQTFKEATGADEPGTVESIFGTTGGGDRLLNAAGIVKDFLGSRPTVHRNVHKHMQENKITPGL